MKKPLGQYGPAGVDDTTSGGTPAKEEDEDDDIDLFGSDEEEVSLVALTGCPSCSSPGCVMSFSHHLSADVVMDPFIPDLPVFVEILFLHLITETTNGFWGPPPSFL